MLDATKIIPEELVPVRRVGRLVLDRVVDNFFAETEQVAFCTQNIVPGVDFTNDPLLQGRNFSYLDTQLKRLGSPNFTYLPINAPKCPFATFQQDGHMAIGEPDVARELRAELVGRRRSAARARTRSTGSRRSRRRRAARSGGFASETFADHYSQARQFYVSQTPVEQQHITDAFVFELSKVERPDIRERMVANLMNVDEDLADAVADGLGLDGDRRSRRRRRARRSPTCPVARAQHPAERPRLDRGPQGRGARDRRHRRRDAHGTASRRSKAEGATVELVAPKVGGVTTSDGELVPAKQKIDGGPSVLYDAVAVLVADPAVDAMANNAAAKDFVSDAYAHCKFIGYVTTAVPLLEAAGVSRRRRVCRPRRSRRCRHVRDGCRRATGVGS